MKRPLLFIHLIIMIIATSTCSTANNFKFILPDIKNYEDIKIQYLISNDNIKLAYRQIGSAKSKTAFVFIPGSTMYGYYYIPFLKELSRNDILVRVIDIRGHGDSEGPRGDVPYEDSLIDDLALHIKDLKLKNPGINILIGGHSMGGGICGRYLEHNGYNSVKGVVYIAPLFHYKQPGIKNHGYVDIKYLNFLFGGDHTMYQFYNPTSNDPKLVREYSNIMSKASMVSDYSKFRKNHTANTIFIIGKEDELFNWEKATKIFKDEKVKYIILNNTGHLNFKLDPDSLKELGKWITHN